MTKAWKRGSAALAAGAIIAVGMVATQPAPSASAAKGTTATKPVVPTKTVRLMICDKGTYASTSRVWQGDLRNAAYLQSKALRSDELCGKYALVQNQKYTVRVAVWSFEKKKATKKIKEFTFKADRPMTVVTLGTAQKPRLERYRK
ncbi:hypothetical protein [Streptomyces zaomyceticus]|uniref:hypothetical protein n=1 Tax=Streptomyces zaomyceticus TaxID=68286 RepID=UPI00367D5B0A